VAAVACVGMTVLTAGYGTGVAAAMHAAAPTSAGGLSFLWVQPMRNHPVHRLMQAGFLNECKQIHAHCVVVGNPSATNYDVVATVALANAAIAGAHYTCAAVYDPDPSINPFIKKLSQEGYPVDTWHVVPPQGSVPGLDAATGERVPQVGQAAAMAIGARIGGHGTVAVTEGSYNTIENAMASSFTQTMHAHFPHVKVLAPQLEGFEPSAAVAKAVSILQAHPDVNAAFSTTGNGPQTWYGAQQRSGRKLVVIGMDYIRQNLDLVSSGKVFGLAAQPLYPEGAKAADLCAALARHQKVPYYNYLPAKIVTKNDVAPYYGYLRQAGE
jgi:ribose transport system substrate-binding protein